MGRFDGRRAVVTGAGSGIGRACALRLAAEGARVTVGDIRDDGAAETVDLVRKAGGEAQSVHCDVGDEAQVEDLTRRAVDAHGGLEILVANAGNATRGLVHELSLDDWNRVLRVQLTGAFLCARAALRHMVAHGGGAIATIGSVSSVVIGAGGSAASYKAAKGGVLQLTRAIAVEYADRGVRANCICPGAVATNLGRHIREDSREWTSQLTEEPRRYQIDVPMARRADPSEVAGAVAFAVSDEASFITGAALMVDGGYTAI